MDKERFSEYVRVMKEDDFERCFFETVLEYGIQKFRHQNKFAAAVFPEMTEDSANSTLMQIKKRSSKTGVPRQVRLREAFKMAEVAGHSFSSLALEVETKLRLGWTGGIEEEQLFLTGTQLTALPPSSEQHANNGSHEST